MSENVVKANTPELVAFVRGLWQENPIFRQMLGMCPTLAVTADVKSALTMGLAATFVLVCSNIVISLLRNLLIGHLRLLMFTLIIAAFVTVADLVLQAFLPDMSEKLGAFVPLIIVNCLIIGRAEACASRSKVSVSIMDGIGMGLGFTLSLCFLACFREILADGAIFGYVVMPDSFERWNIMKLPAGAFITLGIMLGLNNYFFNNKKK